MKLIGESKNFRCKNQNPRTKKDKKNNQCEWSKLLFITTSKKLKETTDDPAAAETVTSHHKSIEEVEVDIVQVEVAC